jgi:hypothetical protein
VTPLEALIELERAAAALSNADKKKHHFATHKQWEEVRKQVANARSVIATHNSTHAAAHAAALHTATHTKETNATH